MQEKSGKVLTVADGEGRNRVWLAERGFEVAQSISPQRHRQQRLGWQKGAQ